MIICALFSHEYSLQSHHYHAVAHNMTHSLNLAFGPESRFKNKCRARDGFGLQKEACWQRSDTQHPRAFAARPSDLLDSMRTAPCAEQSLPLCGAKRDETDGERWRRPELWRRENGRVSSVHACGYSCTRRPEPTQAERKRHRLWTCGDRRDNWPTQILKPEGRECAVARGARVWQRRIVEKRDNRE